MFHLGGLEEIPKTVSRFIKKIPERCITFGVSFCSAQMRQKASRLVATTRKQHRKAYVIPASQLFGDASE